MLTLRQRPTYDEVVDYLENEQPKIKYPDRKASFLRNSPYLSQFDGDSWLDLEDQENNIRETQMRELEIKKLASNSTQTHTVLKAATKKQLVYQRGVASNELPNTKTQVFDMAYDDNFDDVPMAADKYEAKDSNDRMKRLRLFDQATQEDELMEQLMQTQPMDVQSANINEGAQQKREMKPELFLPSPEPPKHKMKKYIDTKQNVKIKTEENKNDKPTTIKDNKLLKKKQPDEDDIVLTTVNINRNQDMEFWNEQSAREMRSQLNLRFPNKKGDWAFKTRLQILNIIKDLINKGKW